MAVPEHQDKNGRGAVHYHLLIRIPFIDMKKLNKLWRYGYVYIEKIYNHSKVGSYIGKYFAKSAEDPRFDGHRKFYASQNLIQPVVVYGDHLADIKRKIEERGFQPSYQTEYFSEHQGNINYWSYNLYQKPAQETEKE